MLAIFKRELKSYFNNITGCLFIAVNLLFSGIYFTVYHLFYGYPYIAYTISSILFILLISTPILTMKSIAEEKSRKTDQLLLCAPVSELEIVLGKYFAMVCIFAIPVVVMCIYPVFLGQFGTVPYAESYVGILGYFLFGAFCMAVGMLISAMTENLIIAAIGTFAILFIIYILNGLCSMISKEGNFLTSVLSNFDAVTKLNNLMQGTLDFSVIVYFISFICLLLFFVYQIIKGRRISVNKENGKIVIFSSLASIIAIALVFVINYAVKFVPDKFLHLDVTTEGIYNITDTTKELLESLNEDINIYVIANENDYDTSVIETLNRYTDMSKYIKVIYKDPYTNPEFASQYEAYDIANGSIIVEGSRRYKIINYDDLYVRELNYETYTNETTGYDAEGQISSAIAYVESENMPKAYIITGHNEATLSSTVKSLISKGNIETEEINLLNYEQIPEDAQALVIISPTIDYSNEDVLKITDYLDQGGNAIILSSYNENKLEKYDSIIEKYGVSLKEGMVIEESKDNYYQNPYFLLPKLGYCDATENILKQSRYVLMPYSRPFTFDAEGNTDYEYTKVLYTSDSAFAKKNVANADNYDKESEDEDGPFTVGVLIENKKNKGKILYFSSESLLNDNVDSIVGNANSLMVVDGLSSMVDKNGDVISSIPAKNYELTTITVSQAGIIFASLVVIVVFPLMFIITGVYIWLSRRKR